MLRLFNKAAVALIVALGATPAFSQAANFGELKLSPGFPSSAGQISGRTGGTYSLSSIANSDQNGKACIGYAADTPDHIMILQGNFPKLTVQVNSGKDTTLVIRGPNKSTIRCGDDTGSIKDASITDSNWQAGRYEIWVGAIKEGKQWDYSLSVRQ